MIFRTTTSDTNYYSEFIFPLIPAHEYSPPSHDQHFSPDNINYIAAENSSYPPLSLSAQKPLRTHGGESSSVAESKLSAHCSPTHPTTRSFPLIFSSPHAAALL